MWCTKLENDLSRFPTWYSAHSYTYFCWKSLEFVCVCFGGVVHFKVIMDQEALMVTLFFTFMLGAGVGFYLTRFLF
jgi:hypothetical protein